MIITIDGPAGTGKTTVAQKVAEELGFTYIDTGAMYRALTYLLMKQNIDPSFRGNLKQILSEFSFEIREAKGKRRYFVDGEDVTDAIRSPEVTQKVSEVSAIEEVRKRLVSLQRELGKKKNAVFEGRDLGSVVFPDADAKFFLTASPRVRAQRRYREFAEKRKGITEDEVLKEIIARDTLDTKRAISPLIQPKDAHVIDTSDLTIEQVVEQVLSLIRQR